MDPVEAATLHAQLIQQLIETTKAEAGDKTGCGNAVKNALESLHARVENLPTLLLNEGLSLTLSFLLSKAEKLTKELRDLLCITSKVLKNRTVNPNDVAILYEKIVGMGDGTKTGYLLTIALLTSYLEQQNLIEIRDRETPICDILEFIKESTQPNKGLLASHVLLAYTSPLKMLLNAIITPFTEEKQR